MSCEYLTLLLFRQVFFLIFWQISHIFGGRENVVKNINFLMAFPRSRWNQVLRHSVSCFCWFLHFFETNHIGWWNSTPRFVHCIRDMIIKLNNNNPSGVRTRCWTVPRPLSFIQKFKKIICFIKDTNSTFRQAKRLRILSKYQIII